MNPARHSTNRRRAELAKIHSLAKQLGLDDDTYRDVLWTIARVDSARDLDEHGRVRMIEQLRSRLPDTKQKPRPPPDRAPMLHKVRQLLGDRDEADQAHHAAKRKPQTPEPPAETA